MGKSSIRPQVSPRPKMSEESIQSERWQTLSQPSRNVSMIDFPMNVTDCYKCGYFLKGGHFACQKFPHPHNVDHPTDDPNARYLVPAPVTWRNPDGKDIHCNSFVEYIKDTLF